MRTLLLPLSDLRLGPQTTLYLELIHLTDGLPRLEWRMDRTTAVVGDFAIATECGIGREFRDTMEAVLVLHQRLRRFLK